MTLGTRTLLVAASLMALWFLWRWIALERARQTGEPS
jgi:hypothetical protein